LPIAMIVIGSTTNTANCPIQTKIPIFLIVSGVVSLTSIVFCAGIISIKLAEIFYAFGICLIYIEALLQIFSLSWTIVGIVWTVGLKESVQYVNSSLPTYCDESTFKFTFTVLPIQCAFCFISICIFVLICWRNKY
jgi:hypothetical protein